MSFHHSKLTAYALAPRARAVVAALVSTLVAFNAFTPLHAGTKDHPLTSTPRTKPVATAATFTPVPVATPIPSHEGYLLTVGPAGIRTRRIEGTRDRRPPALPPPKIVASKSADTSNSADPALAQKTPVEPSAFSPDAPPNLLPMDNGNNPSVPEKGVAKAEPTESVLVPANRGEMELKDAVVYFDTPIDRDSRDRDRDQDHDRDSRDHDHHEGGSQVALPVIVPQSSPRGLTQPPSKATYRVVKP